MSAEELVLVEDAVFVITVPTDLSIYDFPFARYFACRHPYEPPSGVSAVARVGAVSDYDAFYAAQGERGIALVNDPEQHRRAAELTRWYPALEDITPKSLWFDAAPDPDFVERELGWPIFLKGARQTSRHQKRLSIIEDRAHFSDALDAYANDPILRWQKIVCRKYVELRRAGQASADKVPRSFEFRTFFWRGELVGHGRYWWEGSPYAMTAEEEVSGLSLARKAARRLDVPFLVVDIAQDERGSWLVIECNDAQESGYAGVSPFALWQRVVDIERGR